MFRAFTLGLLVAVAAAPGFAADPTRTKTAKAASETCTCDCCAGGSASQRVFELRTYHTNEGKLDALNQRFREHTNRLFKKHGIEIIGFWTPQDAKDGKGNTLIYLIAFPSREAAAASWKAFQNDPEWIKARDASHKNGVLVKGVDSIYLDPTDYSPIK